MSAKQKKTKVPKATDDEVVFKSNLQCCVCQKKGDHIHHLDGNNNNHDFDNLALLCFEHHELASITGNISKKLSKGAIIKYREHHYFVIEQKRSQAIGVLNNPINQLTEEDLLKASKNAIILIELEKIKELYFNSDWTKRKDILLSINKYSNHSNLRLAYDFFDFLVHVSSQTRVGMTTDIALTVYSLVLDFLPTFYNEENTKKLIEIAKMAIHIGDNMVYDSLIHLGNMTIAMHGLTIIKFVYLLAKRNSISELIEEISNTYNELESTIRRPERNNLENAQILIQIFKQNIDKSGLSFPSLPENLMKVIYNEK